MRLLSWLTILWPGLPQLWLRGSWSDFVVAGGFAALLNVSIVASWGYTEILPPAFRLIAWPGLLLFWGGFLLMNIRAMPSLLGLPDTEILDALFTTAQTEYLNGNWFEAEVALNRVLELNPNDIDAHLLLASLLRKIGHVEEAKQTLRHLATITGCGKWQLEIAREWQMLRGMKEVDPPTELHFSPAVSAQNMHPQGEPVVSLPNAA
ncbi:MAG: tetratricopeptide repeat protein [Planctomycetota bacterium]|nr:tetratricopeptide repeat protein [Planctomycetota bacterium]